MRIQPHRSFVSQPRLALCAGLGALLCATLATLPQALAQSALTPSEVYRQRAEAEKTKREQAERQRQAALAEVERQKREREREREAAEAENQSLRLELQALKDKDKAAVAARLAAATLSASQPAPPAPAPTPAAEPYPLVDGMAPAGLKQLQAAAAQRAGLAEVRFTDRLANGQAGPVMVVVPAGRFQMGSAGGDTDEKPVRPGVRVDGFALMQTEVTVGQYLACVADGGCAEPEWREAGSKYHYQSGSEEYYKRLGASLTDPRSPVVGVSWQNAGHYAAWLSKGTNRGYRLPTEAEWEYAARAGSPGKWSFGDDESQLGQHAWYSANSGGQLKPVGTKQANPWQLKDLHGSVWEWVQDCYHGNYSGAPETGAEWQVNCADTRRVVRGGAWDGTPIKLRSAIRSRLAPDYRNGFIGFRLARTF